jgi:AraC-like DNA-binding protein
MIKSAIGMNFRDFLCFARVEFSEMDLLESDSKIHAVAKKVGFSTTAYYEKFFTMWFGEAPEEHKHKYLPMVKSPFRPSRLNQVGVAPALSMVQRNMPAMKRTSYETHVKHLKLFININSKTPTLTTLHPASEVTMSCRDYEKLGTEVFNILKNLNCSKVYIENSPGEADAEPLRIALEKRGYPVEVKPNTHLNYATVYGLDSIANMIHILQNNLLQPGPVPIKLMDSGSEDIMLKGERGIITSSGIYKPSYYAHLILGILKGDLIFHDNHYSVIRIGEERTSYVIIAMNYSNSVDRVCTSSYSLHEVRDILNDYKDELDIDINILDLHGKFAIKKYSFSATGNIFGFMSKLGFPNSYTSPVETSLNFQTVPETDVFVEEIDSSLHLNYSIVGTGLQVTIIESLL